METVEEILAHYGVKGMKWGVRRDRSVESIGSRGKTKVKEAPSHDSQHATNIHTRVKSQKSTRILSNKELQDAINRMNLEQQYSRLSGGNDKTKIQKGQVFFSKLLTTAVGQGAQQMANDQVKTAMNNAMKNAKK